MERWLSIGGQLLRFDAAATVVQAIDARFGAFAAAEGPGAIAISVEETQPFESRLEQVAEVALRHDGARLRLSGGVEGWYDPVERRGELHHAAGLGAVDAMVRLALSSSLPADGTLLLHGAALLARGGGVALLGASGAGKSTAAAAFAAACDELVVARLDGDGATLHATPYWRGRPWSAPIRAVICLERGGATVRRLHGSEAARSVLRNVMRFVMIDSVERRLIETCAALCRRVPVEEARCPEGEAFLPFLRRHLEDAA